MYFDDMELMQLEFCMKQTEDKMMMGGEIRRHESITQKIKEEMEDRKNKNELPEVVDIPVPVSV